MLDGWFLNSNSKIQSLESHIQQVRCIQRVGFGDQGTSLVKLHVRKDECRFHHVVFGELTRFRFVEDKIKHSLEASVWLLVDLL